MAYSGVRGASNDLHGCLSVPLKNWIVLLAYLLHHALPLFIALQSFLHRVSSLCLMPPRLTLKLQPGRTWAMCVLHQLPGGRVWLRVWWLLWSATCIVGVGERPYSVLKGFKYSYLIARQQHLLVPFP